MSSPPLTNGSLNTASHASSSMASCSGERAMLPPTPAEVATVLPLHATSTSPHPLQPTFASSSFSAPTNFSLSVLPPHSSATMPHSALQSYPPLGETALPPRTETTQSPSFPWRSGKWLPAEEHYALLLVALFERGLIADGVDGTTTLRTYLSQKLHCAPMRISKKFAGRGIGKLVYSSSSKPSLEPQKAQELLERLRVAEQLFLQAAYPPPVVASVGAPSFPLLSVPTTVAQPLPFPTVMPGMVATGLPTPSTGEAMQAHTKQLHESYLRALQQADEESTVNKSASSSMPPPVNMTPMVPTVAQPPSEIPDLLSGFEKVVQKNQTTVQKPPSVPPPVEGDYSPPFTSRSFDEFHRFLGKEELTLLDAPSSPPESVTVPDTAALFTAESYAMLAQASAMEASRHGAYAMPPLLYRPASALDVDQVLQQVGVHHASSRPPVSPQTSIRPMVEVHRSQNTSSLHGSHHASTVMTTDAHHVTATSRSEGNIVSGSEPSGSSSSRSNTDNTSSGSDTTGTASNDDDCSEEGVASCDTSDSYPDDDDEEEDTPMPPRKKNKGVESRGKPKRVQFQ